MTYKEKIVKFLEIKNRIIYSTSNVRYINEEDIEDIKHWSEEDCKKTYKYMIEVVNNDDAFEFYPNSTTCPWCIYYHFINNNYDKCNECGYGRRHGICDEPYSKYKELVYGNSFTPLNRLKYMAILNKIEDSEGSNDLQREINSICEN